MGPGRKEAKPREDRGWAPVPRTLLTEVPGDRRDGVEKRTADLTGSQKWWLSGHPDATFREKTEPNSGRRRRGGAGPGASRAPRWGHGALGKHHALFIVIKGKAEVLS